MKKLVIPAIIASLATILAFIVSMPMISCNGKKNCCPVIRPVGFDKDVWICSARCPGGGKAIIMYTVEFWKGEERCNPKNVTIKLRKCETDECKKADDIKEIMPDLGDKPGVYSFKEEINFSENDIGASFLIGVQSDDCEYYKTHQFKVEIYGPEPKKRNLTFVKKIDWPGEKGWKIEISAPNNLIVSQIANLNIMDLIVRHDGLDAVIGDGEVLPLSQSMTAGGIWEIEVPNIDEFKKFNQAGQPAVSIELTLSCGCE